MTKRLEVFKDKAGEWRWHLKAENGEVVSSSEGYRRRIDAVDEAKTIFGASDVEYVIEGTDE